MQFISGGHFPVCLYSGEEVCVVVERAGQLVRVAFVQVCLQIIVPRECPVIVECVAATNADAIEERVLLQQFGDAMEVGHRLGLVGGLFPHVVGLVEGGDAHHLQTLTLHVCYTGLDEFVPFLWFTSVVGAACVVGLFCGVAVLVNQFEQCLVVAVDVHLLGAGPLDEVAAPFQPLLLTFGQRVGAIAVVDDEVDGLEGYAASGEVARADVGDTAVHVVVPVPCGIHAPVHFVFFTCVINIEVDGRVGGFLGNHEVGAGLCMSA